MLFLPRMLVFRALGNVRLRDANFSKKRVPSRADSTCPLLSVFWEVLNSVAGLAREHSSTAEGFSTFEGQK